MLLMLNVAIFILLVLVEMIGFVGKGAQRWVDLGFIRLQPSEFMKPAIALVLARFYDLLPASDVRRWRGLWPAAALVFVPAGLILVQSAFETAPLRPASAKPGRPARCAVPATA